MTVPETLLSALDGLAAHDTVLVATDFDGVLAPLVMDPMAARPLEGTVESLAALADLPGTHVAMVSGRDLATLQTVSGVNGGPIHLIGSHGAEIDGDAGASLDEGQRRTLQTLTEQLEEVAAAHPDSYLEYKPAGRVLHTRRMTDLGAADSAAAAATRVGENLPGVKVMHGKQVVEMSVVTADKGSALEALRSRVGAGYVVYFGDDVTDEHVFERLGSGDIGVKVGPGDSAAGHRLEAPEDVAQALSDLVDLRRTRVGPSVSRP